MKFTVPTEFTGWNSHDVTFKYFTNDTSSHGDNSIDNLRELVCQQNSNYFSWIVSSVLIRPTHIHPPEKKKQRGNRLSHTFTVRTLPLWQTLLSVTYTETKTPKSEGVQSFLEPSNSLPHTHAVSLVFPRKFTGVEYTCSCNVTYKYGD